MGPLLIKGCSLIVGVFFLSGCYYDSQEYLYPSLDSECDTTIVTYSVTINKILTENCFSCHSNANAASSGENIKLENYADVKIVADNGQLLGAITHSSGYSPMPKNGGSLSTCNIAAIKKWIDLEAPNN